MNVLSVEKEIINHGLDLKLGWATMFGVIIQKFHNNISVISVIENSCTSPRLHFANSVIQVKVLLNFRL